MLTTPHAIAGATIGALLPDPLLAIPLAVASHFVLDSIPHWQETLAPYIPTRKTYIRIPLDIALAIGLTMVIAHWHPESASIIWLAALAANLPDLDSIVVVIPRLKTGLIKQFWDWHCRIQRETRSLWGVLTQLIFVISCLVIADKY